jgi:hypothetical protein
MMGKRVFKVFRLLVAVYLVAAIAVIVFSKQAKGQRRDQIRMFNRDTLNPWMMKRAGGEHWYASVVKHMGRTSGKEYETPVVMHPIDGHVAIPLPYGQEVDWLENLRHVGGGRAVHKGLEYELTEPVIVTRSAIAEGLGRRDSLRSRVFGIEEFVQLRAVPVEASRLVAV